MTKTITPLKPALADKIHAVIQSAKPFDAVNELATILRKPVESSPFDKETHEELLQIFNVDQERLLLHFATYSPENFDRLNLSQSLDDEHYIVTSLATDINYNSVVYSYIKRYDSDVEFDLLLVDKYQDNDDDDDDDDNIENNNKLKYISTYLYGNPYSEDWTEKSITHFDKIKKVCDGVKEHEKD